MIRDYRLRWSYYMRKLNYIDKHVFSNPSIYKELLVNETPYLITKAFKGKKIIYRCKRWNGVKWQDFYGSSNNPREAMLRIKLRSKIDIDL